jgi:hypothetical protein
MNFIHDICKKYNITNYTINPDGSIDVVGNVNFFNKGLTELPLTFNRVSGDFDCSHNNLTSLKGCPRWIGRYFSCSNNKLTSLEFSPDHIGGGFNCEYNDLSDNYCDTEIGSYFSTNYPQDGLIINGFNVATNYKEWRKLYKRKLILENIFSKNLDI